MTTTGTPTPPRGLSKHAVRGAWFLARLIRSVHVRDWAPGHSDVSTDEIPRPEAHP